MFDDLPKTDFALFAPRDPLGDLSSPLEVIATGRALDPRELCTLPQVYRRFWISGRAIDDWTWVSDALGLPELEPWQSYPFPPVGFPVWTVTGYDPLRIGTSAGTIWLSVDAADDEWKLIKAFVQWERKNRSHHWSLNCDESLFGDVPLDPDDPWSYDFPF